MKIEGVGALIFCIILSMNIDTILVHWYYIIQEAE